MLLRCHDEFFNMQSKDSWLVIIITAVIAHLLLAIIIFILKTYKGTDLYGILQETFGNWLAKVFGYLFIVYFFIVYLSALTKYTEFIVVFIFPQHSRFIIGFLMTILIAYCNLRRNTRHCRSLFSLFLAVFGSTGCWLFLLP